MLGVVLNLCFDKDRVAGCIVPDVNTKGFDADVVCLHQGDRTEDAKGLRAFREAPFAATSTTNPGRSRLHGRMIDIYLEFVLTMMERICDVERPNGASYEFFWILVTVEGNCGISANAFKLQEIAFALLFFSGEGLLIGGFAMQVTMTKLAIAIVIVEIMGEGGAYNGIGSLCKPCLPIIVERCEGATTLTLRLWEGDVAASHGNTSGDSNTTLLVVVDSTIEMINHAIVLDNV